MSGQQHFVKVAQHALGRPGDLLVTLGLGSCVAIMLHDPASGAGGLAHVLLPEPGLARDASNPFKFASTAVPRLLEEMRAMGMKGRPDARLAGGAAMFATLMVPGTLNMGERNIRAAREALLKAGITIRGEDVGGDYGRSVRFRVGEGRVVVTSVGRGDVVL